MRLRRLSLEQAKGPGSVREGQRALSGVLTNLGAMAPDLAEARGFFEEALGLARQAGDTSHERVILANLVNMDDEKGGRHGEALRGVLKRTGRTADGTCAICLEETRAHEDAQLSTLSCARHLFHRSRSPSHLPCTSPGTSPAPPPHLPCTSPASSPGAATSSTAHA